MKILLDEGHGQVFAQRLTELLEPGYEPSKRLRRIAEGRHKMSPALVKYRRRI